MSWTGSWRNQYGSVVRITDDAEGRIEGWFETALADSGFYGRPAPVVGVARGKCIAFSCVGTGPAGDMVVSYAGLLRDGRMETMWYYAGDEALVPSDNGSPPRREEVAWWKAIVANADTFERIDSD